MARILVVDDDPDILSAMKILLSAKGFTVATARCGDETFKMTGTFNPDLIILDVLISGEDGRDICKAIKSDKRTRHIPIIMLSAHPGAAGNMADYGACSFISKPFDVHNLLDKIHEQLGKTNT